jgi:hypothetical protein
MTMGDEDETLRFAQGDTRGKQQAGHCCMTFDLHDPGCFPNS